MRAHEEEDESQHFRPDTWKVAWEATQDVPAPSCQVKAAAERLVGSELLQQATGWLLLTQIGVLLGSFGPIMSVGVCLLSWAVFMLEAMLKFARNWAHRRFFMNVPCSYVPIHQETANDTLSIFERLLVTATLLELGLYVPYTVVVIKWVTEHIYCGDQCEQGQNLLTYLLLICLAITICHGVTSLVTLWTFDFAMGVGFRALIRGKKGRLKQSSLGSLSDYSCSCNKRGCRGGRMFRSLRSQSNRVDRILCLTWWVHMARHRHLSAVVASAQPGNCGLPGHWFETIDNLKKTVEECFVTGTGDHVLNSAGPLWMTQEMGLRALVSLAKQNRPERDPVQICRNILHDGGFELLVKVVREGKFSTSRGLAAAAIGVLATQNEALRKENVHLAGAVIPLKRLARSKEYELKEVAFGALLNTALNDDQFTEVLSQFLTPDGIVGESRGFMSILMEHAYVGLTTRCQELAIGLLARFTGDSIQIRDALIGQDRTNQRGIQMLIELLQHGLTAEIKASTAGVLAELAFKEGRTIGRGPYGESCIQALIQVLRGESRIAYASARALCNLAIKFADNKHRIVAAGGIQRFVELLKERCFPDDECRMQEQVQAEAARALWILSSYNNSANQELIAKAGAIPHLRNLLSNPRPKIHIQAVSALSSLAWKNKTNQDLIGEDGSIVFHTIVGLLIDVHDEDMKDKVLEKVAVAISSFADGNTSNRDKLLKTGALVRLQNTNEQLQLQTNELIQLQDTNELQLQKTKEQQLQQNKELQLEKTKLQKERIQKDKAMRRVRQAIQCLETEQECLVENSHEHNLSQNPLMSQSL